MWASLPFARIMLTGADGFVGRAMGPLIAAQSDASVRIVACGKPIGDWASNWAPLDITDADMVRRLIAAEKPDLIVHLAARSSVAESTRGASETWRTNLVGSVNLAEAIAAEIPTATLFFVSSAEVYGASFNDGVCDETAPVRPRSPYAWTKAAAEAMFAQVLGTDNRLVIARPANHTGPAQDARFVIPSFAQQIARAEAGLQPPVMQVGNLAPERDFLSVDDVIAAYLSLIQVAADLPRRSTFNIASGRPIAVGTILHRLLALSDTAMTVAIDPARQRPSEVPRTALSIDAIMAATDWRPTTELDGLLRRVLDAQRGRVTAGRDASATS